MLKFLKFLPKYLELSKIGIMTVKLSVWRDFSLAFLSQYFILIFLRWIKYSDYTLNY